MKMLGKHEYSAIFNMKYYLDFLLDVYIRRSVYVRRRR